MVFPHAFVLSITIHIDYKLQFYFNQIWPYNTDKEEEKRRTANRRLRSSGTEPRGVQIEGGIIMVTAIVIGAAMLMYVGAEWTAEEVVK